MENFGYSITIVKTFPSFSIINYAGVYVDHVVVTFHLSVKKVVDVVNIFGGFPCSAWMGKLILQ